MNCLWGACALAWATASAGCVAPGTQSCSAVDYFCDDVNVTLQSTGDAWAAGTYTVSWSIDGKAAQCTATIPAAPMDTVDGICSGNDALTLIPVTSCSQVACGPNCEATACTPVLGRFTLMLRIDGTPPEVGLTVALDGNTLVSETIAPSYATTEPNGQGCGMCTRGSATLPLAGG